MRGLRLYAIDGKKILGLAGLHQQAVGVFHAHILTIVFGKIAVAGGEAACREGQRHAAIGKDLGLHAPRAVLLQASQPLAAHFERHDPARGAGIGQNVEGRLAVHVEIRPGDEGAPSQITHRPHVVGFDAMAVVVDHLAHGVEFVARFKQHLCGQHHLLAGVGQHVGDLEPVGQTQFVTPRTDRFTEIDDVDRPCPDGFIELQRGHARPVVLQWT